MKAECLEKIVRPLVLRHAEKLFVKQTNIDSSDDAALRIDHWKREKFVQHEKFARIEHGRCLRNRDHALNHQLGDFFLRLREQKTARRQHAGELSAFIDDVKI